jgi:hypothetical protein
MNNGEPVFEDMRVPNDHLLRNMSSDASACRCAPRRQVCFPPDSD